MLFVSLVICEVVLILSGARAGWVSYPLVLFICWLFFYFTKDGGIKRSQFKWWNLIKVAVSVPVTIAISLLIVFQIVLPLSDALRDKTDVKGKGKDLAVTTGYLKKKAATMITASASSRPMRWKQGFNVGRENPVFGMGYESFRWHADILPGIEGSYCNRNVTSSFADTPHCIFYQLFVSGGIVGLCLWLLIVGYALMILIIDLVRNKRLLNIPVVISIISFHMYGIFQSMQYIPMIWSLIFLCLGYAMTIDEKVLPERVRRIVGVVVKVMICLVLIGGVVYFTDWGSQGLADKYGLQVYGKDQDRNNYLGFYPKEKGPQGIFRFSGKRGLIRVKEDGLLGIRFDCHTPGVDKEPVTVDISVDDQPVGRLTFSEIGPQKWHYWLKKMDEGSHEILIEVSRTWNPKESGVSLDYRDLGLAVGEPEFPKLFPVEGIGFYDWETWRGKPIPGWTGDEMKFRWMGAQAFIPIDLPSKMAYVRKYQRASEMEDQTKGGLQVFFRSFHPDVGTNPIVVEIFSDKMLSKKVTLKGKKWEKIAFDQNEIKDSKVLGFKVSRTWNPSLLGISEDRRDLGVAVVYRYGVVNAASRSF